MKISLFFILSTAVLINGQGRPSLNYGTKATSNQFPYAATIYRELNQICNGAIVSEFYIITAAHCFDGATAAQLSVIVGSISPSSNYRQVQRTHQHSAYNSNGFSNDIGFIQLRESLIYNNKIRPIAYETQPSPRYNLNCQLIRFKSTDSTRSLWYQNVAITTYDDCKSLYPELHANERCILTPYEPVRSPRPGDSGAPIVCNGKLTAILGTSMTTTIDMAATVVMVAPYQRWIGDRIY